ncbi:MAG: hypothetical protein IPN34_19410 [Planctomycetes bacterium]|nr:hypothetical protein [Planctomycetota bacterium]
MRSAFSLFLVPALASLAMAQAPTLQISIGVRETGFAGGTFNGTGTNGGASGGIEFVARDAQTLVLDGTWQQFTFNLTTDPILAFAGASANSVLEGAFGTLEHVRILNNTGITAPIQLWIDDIENTVTPTGGAPITTTVQNFEGFTEAQEVTFQEPSFSGSTAANLLTGSTAGINNALPSRSSAYRMNFQFIDNVATRWVRATTFNTPTGANPQIRFDDNAVLSFWMRGGECQQDAGFGGPGTARAEMCGSGLSGGESSIYSISGAPIAAPGLVFISLAGLPDLPFSGGTLLSGFGYQGSFTVFSDLNGAFSLPVGGSPFPVDLVVQTLFIDGSLPELLAFTNAIVARFGV